MYSSCSSSQCGRTQFLCSTASHSGQEQGALPEMRVLHQLHLGKPSMGSGFWHPWRFVRPGPRGPSGGEGGRAAGAAWVWRAARVLTVSAKELICV